MDRGGYRGTYAICIHGYTASVGQVMGSTYRQKGVGGGGLCRNIVEDELAVTRDETGSYIDGGQVTSCTRIQ